MVPNPIYLPKEKYMSSNIRDWAHVLDHLIKILHGQPAQQDKASQLREFEVAYMSFTPSKLAPVLACYFWIPNLKCVFLQNRVNLFLNAFELLCY